MAEGDAGDEGGGEELDRPFQFNRVGDKHPRRRQAPGRQQGASRRQGKLDVAVDVLVGGADVA